jgi:hypothetical protein
MGIAVLWRRIPLPRPVEVGRLSDFLCSNRSPCASVVVVIVVLAQILCANCLKKNELLENFVSVCLSLVLCFDVLISPQRKRPKRHRN